VGESIPLFLESYYGEMAAELSAVGLAAFLWLSGGLLLALMRAVRSLHSSGDRGLAGAVLAVAVLEVVSNYFSNALDLAVTSISLWFLTGLALRLPVLVQDEATRFDLVRALSDRSRRGLPCDRSRRSGTNQTNPPETALAKDSAISTCTPLADSAPTDMGFPKG
jgi:hypothetical protein